MSAASSLSNTTNKNCVGSGWRRTNDASAVVELLCGEEAICGDRVTGGQVVALLCGEGAICEAPDISGNDEAKNSPPMVASVASWTQTQS